MRKALVAIILLVMLLPASIALELVQVPDVPVTTGQQQKLTLQYREENVSLRTIILSINGPSSVVIDSRIRQYKDTFTIYNGTWESYKITIADYEPGDHVIVWQMNDSNGTLINQTSFTLKTTGNSTPIGNNGTNDTSEIIRPRQRYGSVPFIRNATNLTVQNKTNITNVAIVPVIVKNETVEVVAPPVEQKQDIALAPRPVQNVTPQVEAAPVDQQAVNTVMIILFVIVAIVGIGVWLFVRYLKKEEKK